MPVLLKTNRSAQTFEKSAFSMFHIQSNLAIRNFLITLKLFLNAKSSLSLWSKLAIGHGKWFLNTNLFLIKQFLITKFDFLSLRQITWFNSQLKQTRTYVDHLGFSPRKKGLNNNGCSYMAARDKVWLLLTCCYSLHTRVHYIYTLSKKKCCYLPLENIFLTNTRKLGCDWVGFPSACTKRGSSSGK